MSQDLHVKFQMERWQDVQAANAPPPQKKANLMHQSMLLEGCKRLQDILDISEIPYGGLRNVVECLFVCFFFLKNFFWTPQQNKKRQGPHVA